MSGLRKIDNKGFTLVEVMLSIAILALISVPLMKYFSDSLRYAVQTEEKQKATMIAQETMETIKAQRNIVQASSAPSASPAGPTTYVLAPELSALFSGYAGASSTPTVIIPDHFSSSGATLDAADSPKPMVYRYVDARSKSYYIETSIYCETDAASVSSPAILGIDDSRNVVISERTEQQDALTYFKTANLNYYLGHNGTIVTGSSTPSPTPNGGLIYITMSPGPTITPGPDPRLITEEEFAATMKRIIFISISKQVGDTYYKVRANYVYYVDDAYGDGTGEMKRVSPDLVEANMETLEGIYLMFNKLRPDVDDIVVQWDVAGSTDYPDFRFIVQDDVGPVATSDPFGTPSASPTAVPTVTPTTSPTTTPTAVPSITPGPEGYKLRVTFWDFDGTDAPTVHSNLDATSFKFYKLNVPPVEHPDEVETKGIERTDIVVRQLTGDGIPVRIFNVEVKVYKDKDAYTAGKDPLIALQSTKVE